MAPLIDLLIGIVAWLGVFASIAAVIAGATGLKIASASGCERQPKMAEMVAATMLMANSHEKASTKRSILELILLQANEHSTTQYKSSGACATSVINLRLKFSQR